MNKKSKTVLIVSALTLVIGTGAYVALNKPNNTKKENDLPQTINVKKETLNQSLTVSGTIDSTNSAQVNSLIPTSKIVKVNVSEGDVVKKGDVLFQLDTTAIDQQIENEKKNIQNQLEAAQKAYDNAVLGKDRGWGHFDQARKAKDNACNTTNLDNLKSAMDASSAIIAQAQNQVDTALAQANQLLAEYNACLATPIVPSDDPLASPLPIDCKTYQDAYDAKMAEVKAHQMTLESTKLSSGYTQASTAYTQAVANCDALTKQFETIDIQQQGLEAQVSATKEALDKINTGTSPILDNLYLQRKDYTICAPIDGTITAINASENALPTGSLATISDTSNLKVKCNIAEYDIQSLALEMEATIKTDANEQVYQGKITHIAQTSNASNLPTGNASTSSAVTFPIEISLPTDANLLIGMNAQVEITLQRQNNGYVVPLDAIETKENENYIYVYNQQDQSFTPCKVDILLSNDYYASIKAANIDENTQIIANVLEETDNLNTNDSQGNVNE